MNNTTGAITEFDRKLSELQKQARPSHIGSNLKEVILYEKLLEIQSKLIAIENRLLKDDAR